MIQLSVLIAIAIAKSFCTSVPPEEPDSPKMATEGAARVLFAAILLLLGSSGIEQLSAAEIADVCALCNGDFIAQCGEWAPPLPVYATVCNDTANYKPLEEFVSEANQDYFYTNHWTIASQNGYDHSAQIAMVAVTNMTGTAVPLLTYSNPPRHFYTTDANETAVVGTVQGAPGFEGYLLAKQGPGTVALSRFKAGLVQRLALDYDRTSLEQRGWVFQKTLGYVYRPCPTPLL